MASSIELVSFDGTRFNSSSRSKCSSGCPHPCPPSAWQSRKPLDRIKPLKLLERLEPLERSLLVRRYAALQPFIVSAVPLGFVIRQLVQQKDIVVGAVAGTDAPLGVNAFAPRHRQTVLLPTVVIVAHQLEIVFQRNRRLWVLRDQVRTRPEPPLVEQVHDSV